MASDVSTATLTAGRHVPHTKSCRKMLSPGIPRVTPSMTSDDSVPCPKCHRTGPFSFFKDGDPTRRERQLRATADHPSRGEQPARPAAQVGPVTTSLPRLRPEDRMALKLRGLALPSCCCSSAPPHARP